MAEGNTSGNDQEKVLSILEKCNNELSAMVGNIDRVNKNLGDFSANFNRSAESIKNFRSELSLLNKLTGKNFKFSGFNVGGTAKQSGGHVAGSSSHYKASDISSASDKVNKELHKKRELNEKLKTAALNRDTVEFDRLYKQYDKTSKSADVKSKILNNIRASRARKYQAEKTGLGNLASAPGVSEATKKTGIIKKMLDPIIKLGKNSNSKGLKFIATYVEKLAALNPTLIAGTIAVAALIKEVKFLVQCSKEAQENLNKTSNALNQMGVTLTDSQSGALEAQGAKNRLSNRWQNFKNNVGITDFWNYLAIGADKLTTAIAGEEGAKEPDSLKYGAMAEGTGRAYQSGFGWQSSVNLGENIYDVLADLVSQHFPQFKGAESTVTGALVDAIFSGSNSGIADFGLTIDDDTLAGYAAMVEKVDMVNVEYSEAYKQLMRYKLLLYELSEDSIKSRQEDIKQWKQLGSVMEKCKQTLFGFDEVITLSAYDPTIPDYGWQWSNRAAVPIDATKEEADKALEETHAETPDTSSVITPNNSKITYNIDASDIKDAFYDGSDYAYDMIYKAFKDGADLINGISINVNMPSGGTQGIDPTSLLMLLLPLMLKGTGGGNSDVFTDLPSGAVDDNTKLYLNPIDTSAPASFLGYGPEQNSAKEWGFAWGGPGSATDILIDVTGNNNYIGKRMTMTDSEAREWASNNYYRFGPDEDGSTTARGVDIGNFYQPNSASKNEVNDLELLYRSMQVGAGTTGVTAGLGSTALGAALIATGIGAPLGAILMGLGLMGTGIGAYNTFEGTNEINKMTGQGGYANGGIGTKPVTGATLFEDGAEAVIPLESQAGIDFLGNAMRQAMGGEEGFGGDQIIVNLNLSGLNVADDDSRWEQIGTKIAEVIDVQRQRRGELNYGAAY